MVNNPNITVSKWNDSTSYLITPQTITLIIHTENVSPATQVKMNGYLWKVSVSSHKNSHMKSPQKQALLKKNSV